MIPIIENCPVCHNQLTHQAEGSDYNNNFHFDCAYCGEFEINGRRMVGHYHLIDSEPKPAKDMELCIALRHLYEDSKIISEIRLYEDIARIKHSVRIPSSPLELIDILLLYLHMNTKKFDQYVKISPTLYPLLFVKDQEEFHQITYFARKMKYIIAIPDDEQNIDQLRLDLKGWERISQLVSGNVTTKQVFIAMKFGSPVLDEAYEKGILEALGELGFHPHRVDQEDFLGKVCEKIIADINLSDFIIADFSYHRGNVYFEAGYALGQRKPVIWCCKKGSTRNLQFDTRQYNHIVWENADDLYKKLIYRIQATIL